MNVDEPLPAATSPAPPAPLPRYLSVLYSYNHFMYLSTILSTFNSYVVDTGVRSLSPGFKEKEKSHKKDIQVRPVFPVSRGQ